MAHLTKTMTYNVPVGDLDAAVRDPRDWPRFWVGLSEPHRVFGDGSPGTKAEFTMHLMGVGAHTVFRTIEERHGDDGSTLWRWDFEGAIPGSLTCHHRPRDGHTETTTEMEYSVPGRVFGAAADRLLFEKRMRRDMENSLENLKLLVEFGASTSLKKTA